MIEPEKFWPRVDTSGDCWIWTGARQSQGYGMVQVRTGERVGTVSKLTHRVAYHLARGPFPDHLHVLHKCDNPPCCNPAHLFLGTAADNAADKVAKGRARAVHGEAHQSAKLTATDVLEIRRRVSSGEMQSVVASAFKVSRASIWQIVHRKHWSHIGDAA